MNIQASNNAVDTSQIAELQAAFEQACEYIAPTWPLDKMIAVNPLWELRQFSYADVAARISALGNIHTHLPSEYYANEVEPKVTERHLELAAREMAVDGKASDETLTAVSGSVDEDQLAHWLNISDLLDQDRDEHQMSWHEEIIHEISQFCADSFRSNGPCSGDSPAGTLYSLWLARIQKDYGVSIIMGAKGMRQAFSGLPTDPDALLALAAAELGLNSDSAEPYAHALLLDVNGWASWIAYLRWQERLQGGDSALMKDLLAIRLAWELVLWRYTQTHRSTDFRRMQSIWQRQIAVPKALISQHKTVQRHYWQWQRAAELAFQEQMSQRLAEAAPAPAAGRAALQAVFCIDVRSEVIRRHLEAQNPGIQTRGFAGFFGLPIEYQTADAGFDRPQLPGLLAPALTVRSPKKEQPAARNRALSSWFNTADSPAAMFSLVETSGPFYLWKLLRDSFSPGSVCDPVKQLADTDQIEFCRAGEPIGLDERVDLAAGVLHAMGLETGFAPTVLLVGHGAESPNNPHAASLNCGACGGQSGELNSLLLAKLLNDADIRQGLADKGVVIPEDTRFVAALHETVTDELRIVEGVDLSEEVEGWLQLATAATRRERAAKLDLQADSDAELEQAFIKRARDWSQVRPEWALAGNAAFVVAPRDRTRGLDLQGRAFLHDYDWQQDQDLSVLELIMTAPMVVTNWINMQYNASVTDNDRYGSGNKVLHNVVGGNIGVFEGNGGDLRIGLPMQSVHDGNNWMHTPLRLSVYIAAPAESIKEIYQRHEVVRQLIDNDWLYLFRLDDSGECSRLYQDQWLATA